MDKTTNVKASQIVSALADMASKGKYDNVTIESAANMNSLFVLVAELINKLEDAESAPVAAADAKPSEEETDIE